MPELALSQGTLFLIYGIAGCCFGVLFHILELLGYVFRKMHCRWLTVLCDILFWLVFTVVVYVMNYNLTYGEVRFSLLCAMLLGALVIGAPIRAVKKARGRR